MSEHRRNPITESTTNSPSAEYRDFRVGFVGVGDMGLPMLSRLVTSGLDTSVYDVNKEAAQRAASKGARISRSIRDLSEGSDTVLVCVAFDEQIREVVLGDQGILSSARPGTAVVIHSTAPPSTIEELAKAAIAAQKELLDAPLSGGTLGAEEGTLTVMAGGDPSLIERLSPILSTYARSIFHMGPPGTGQVAKLINNLLLASNRAGVIEGLRLARAYNIGEEQLMTAVSASTGSSYVQQHWERLGRHRGRLSEAADAEILDRAAKDLRYALTAAHERYTYLPVSTLIAELLPQLMAELDEMRTSDSRDDSDSGLA